MKTAYLLMHNRDPLGIFDSPEIPEVELKKYFGEYVKRDFQDVRDSGIEWVMKIYANHRREELTMMYFGINEI